MGDSAILSDNDAQLWMQHSQRETKKGAGQIVFVRTIFRSVPYTSLQFPSADAYTGPLPATQRERKMATFAVLADGTRRSKWLQDDRLET